MINLNGSICSQSSFNWLQDSGFRYGYGCFETMLMVRRNVPLFDYHYTRIAQSLDALGLILIVKKPYYNTFRIYMMLNYQKKKRRCVDCL